MSSTIDLRAGELDELERRQADRPGADDRGTSRPACGFAAVDRVAADGERLDEGELLEGELRETCSLRAGTMKQRPQAAVAVDAERLDASRSSWCGRGGRRSSSGS